MANDVALMEKRMVAMPEAPTSVADVDAVAGNRVYVAKQKSPIDFAVKNYVRPACPRRRSARSEAVLRGARS